MPLRNRKLPVPVSFMVVVSAVIALFIFFGAWAVSVDAANQERELTFAIGNSATFGVNSVTSQTSEQSTPAEATDGGGAADTWWGHSLLIACPLH